jgi:PST family polysaccharide transporter
VEAAEQAPPKTQIGQRAARGLLMMLAQNVVSRASVVVSQLVLAALLLPADFGLISLTYTVSNMATVLVNVGIEDVLLQRHRGLRLWTGPGFWASLLLSTLAALGVVLVSPLAASIYHAPSLVGLLAVMALAMPVGALGSVPSMLMRARLQFGAIAAYGGAEIVAQSVLTVALAWAGFGAYSFAIPVPILAASRTLVFWRLARSKVSLRPKVGRWRHMLANTGATFATRLLITSINQGDYMVLGLLASHDEVGRYYFGFRLSAQPLWLLAGNFSNVMMPALVQLKADPRRQGEAALRASTLLSFCVMPLAFLQAAIAGPLLIFFFKQKWAAAIPVVQLLSIGLAMDAVSWVAGSLMNARGEFKMVLRYISVQAPVFFALVCVGALTDRAQGVAIAVAIFYTVTQPFFVAAAFRRVGVSTWRVALLYLRPGAIAAVSVGAGIAISLLPGLAGHPLLRCVVICAVVAPIYLFGTQLVAPDIGRDLWHRIQGAVRRP